MDQTSLQAALADLPLGGLRYFDSVGSTNDAALTWAADGASDSSVVVADAQTAGRGRAGRKWATPARAALAFSLILRPRPEEAAAPNLVTGLGAVALVDALAGLGLPAQIKWPNDVLVNGKKVAGILVETTWRGDQIEAMVLGIGVNVLSASAPTQLISFPATTIETELGRAPDRLDFLVGVLGALLLRRARLADGELWAAWNQSLAYRGETVRVLRDEAILLEGRLEGLAPDGSLRLQTGKRDNFVTVHFGEIHLRPAV